jgi:hypothetical protein
VTENVEFVNDRERLLFARARLGSDVLDFLRSPTGKYLHGRAKADYETAKEELIGMSLVNIVKYWRVKRRAIHAQTFMKYCVDVIQDGEVAYQELQQES